ncbi:GTPase family protein [Desulfovibrio sp. QI0442]
MENKNDIYSAMEHDVSNSDLSEEQKKRFFKNILQLKNQEINLMITGATGCGKSSTINALFGTEVARVGVGVDPETMDISRYELKNLILWDSPGLGDGKEADTRHAKNITQKLHERDKNGKALIDFVLVILDGGSRDLGTSYELINSVIIPNLGKEREGRILVGRIQLASATPSRLNEKARWYSTLASPSNQRLRGVWAMHTLPGKNGTTSARQ